MITLLDINIAVNRTIKKAVSGLFQYDVPIVSEELKEPILRPSIKVMFDGAKSKKFNSCCKERSLTCKIYFFAKNKMKPKFENIMVQQIFENAFLEGLVISPRFIVPIEDLESRITDSVLVCSFDISTIEFLPDIDTSEMMEELKYSQKKEVK